MNKADQIIADKIIANHLYLMRFSAGEKRKVLDIISQMQTELKAKLATGLTSFGKARVDKLLKECAEIIQGNYLEMSKQIDAPGLAKQQATATAESIGKIGVDVSIPGAAVMKATISETLLSGAPLSEWWTAQRNDFTFKFTNQVRQGVAQGETIQQIVKRVVGSPVENQAGIMELTKRNAMTLVHDSVMQIANDAKLTTYKENSDVIEAMQQLSTLDSHTSQICIAYSGATWDLDGNPINGTSLAFDGGCPRHPNCRSVIVPITKSYKELGIDIPEMKPGTRSSDIGQVKADMSFNSFLNRHSVEYQNQLLGKGKADLWRSGKISLSDLVTQNGRPLTLAQLSG